MEAVLVVVVVNLFEVIVPSGGMADGGFGVA